jgi:diguanylate cyclase (GGDEF)-like protein/PAS domain S-box-containing protein
MLSDRSRQTGFGDGRWLTDRSAALSHGADVRRAVLAMVTDAAGRLAYVNRELLAFGGWSWADIAGRHWHDALVARGHREQARTDFEAALAVEDGPSYIETTVRGSDGRLRTVAWSSTASLDEYGNALTVTSVGIDVTRWAEERDRLTAEREFEASHDIITGLVNAATFRFQLGIELAALKDGAHSLAVLLIGIDRFHGVIETLGHEAGDRLLGEVAGRIEACGRGATVARWTGDEFVILISGSDGPSEAIMVAESIVEAMSVPCTSCGTDFNLGASVGIVLAPTDGDNASTLMRHAAMAMRSAKSAGGLRHALFSASLSTEAKERILLEQQLLGALSRREISVVYQPQVDADTHRIVGVEALARWTHPELGSVSPSRFIPLAEEMGLIATIGRFVLQNALEQSREWRDQGRGTITVAVNVSAHQLSDAGFVDEVRRLLDESQTPPDLLEIEITETAAMADVASAAEALRQLAELGITISLDDFGTGYSNIGKLNDLAISTIKIDRSFLGGPDSVGKPAALLSALVALGRSLDLRIIAEGVETSEQLERLRNHNLDAYQGFLFAHPLPAAEVSRLLEAGAPLSA